MSKHMSGHVMNFQAVSPSICLPSSEAVFNYNMYLANDRAGIAWQYILYKLTIFPVSV